MHPGRYGANSDASGSCNALERGWGTSFQGYFAQGTWSEQLREVIKKGEVSISPLDLLTVALCLHVGNMGAAIPESRLIVLRNDNESACMAINTERAFSGPMLEALRVFTKVQNQLLVDVRMEHIPGECNEIADDLSRGRTARANNRLSEVWKQVVKVVPPEEIEGWVSRIIEEGCSDRRLETRKAAGRAKNNP